MRHTISTGIVSMLLTGIAWAQVDLNKAQEIELDGLNGLGPTMTRAIMNERQKTPFRDWTDVMQRVKGIGPKKRPACQSRGYGCKASPMAKPLHPP